MNAEVLVGKVLGSYTLRRVIGQGSMGAVYLARHAESRRKVVVKVFLQASSLEPLQYIDFLVRFRQQMELVASLEHTHILPVYEFGERDGYVYLVMPYVTVRTLESVLNSQELLPLSKAADYVDQLAGALDYAHEQEVLHSNIKPSNILVTDDDTLLLTDFALTKTMTERQAARIRQFKVGMLDYMAPEQVVGKEAGEKADLYSLGAVLYHLVTGSAPFHGQSLVEVAKKHLQESPPSPRSKRADLPLAAEKSILRALAKRPPARYARAQDLATAFRLALAAPPDDLKLSELPQTLNDSPVASGFTSSGIYPRYSLFDPGWRTDYTPVASSGLTTGQSASVEPAPISTQTTAVFASVITPPTLSGQESESEKTFVPMPLAQQHPTTPVLDQPEFGEQTTNPGGAITVQHSEQSTTGTTIKLTTPVKLVNMPVAGQPGRYVIGLMPTQDFPQLEMKEQFAAPDKKLRLDKKYTIAGIVMLVMFLLGTGTLWFAHQLPHPKTPPAVTIVKTPDVKATAAAQATATATANIILSDPLAQNIHDWPIITSGPMIYTFKDGVYHIIDNDDTRAVPAILPGVILKNSFVYTLTMEEIKGDTTSVNNEFGMIIDATIQKKNGKTISTFYTFEVLNKAGGEYQFWKYDDSQGSSVSPWKKLGNHPFGNEFHEGLGSKSINTFKIMANGKNFTLVVNGKQVWTVQDSSLVSGSIGMLVNLKGTEVAFSNLLLTYK